MFFRDDDEPESVPPPPMAPEAPKETLKGSGRRYGARIDKFQADGRPWPRARHHGLWLLHNVVAHPLLGVFPNRMTVEIHELTSAWLGHEEHAFERARRILWSKVPEIPNRKAWLFHNCNECPVLDNRDHFDAPS